MLTSIHNDHNFQVFKLDKILARPETTGIALFRMAASPESEVGAALWGR